MLEKGKREKEWKTFPEKPFSMAFTSTNAFPTIDWSQHLSWSKIVGNLGTVPVSSSSEIIQSFSNYLIFVHSSLCKLHFLWDKRISAKKSIFWPNASIFWLWKTNRFSVLSNRNVEGGGGVQSWWWFFIGKTGFSSHRCFIAFHTPAPFTCSSQPLLIEKPTDGSIFRKEFFPLHTSATSII